jgi:hypothetical protein
MSVILFVLAAAVILYGMARPQPQVTGVASRVLMLTICGTGAYGIFSNARADDTVALALVVLLIAGWIATLSYARTSKPGVRYGSAWIVPTAPEKEAVMVGAAAAAVLLAIVLLQKSSMTLGIPSRRADVASLLTFATCLACWSVIVGVAITPWRMNRRWTLPTTLVVVAVFAIVVPVSWLASNQDRDATTRNVDIQQQERTAREAERLHWMQERRYGDQGPMAAIPSYDAYPDRTTSRCGGEDPFATASDPASSMPRMTFAASASIVATNLLAILGWLTLLVRMLTGRFARFEDDDAHLPGEVHVDGSVASPKGTSPDVMD